MLKQKLFVFILPGTRSFGHSIHTLVYKGKDTCSSGTQSCVRGEVSLSNLESKLSRFVKWLCMLRPPYCMDGWFSIKSRMVLPSSWARRSSTNKGGSLVMTFARRRCMQGVRGWIWFKTKSLRGIVVWFDRTDATGPTRRATTTHRPSRTGQNNQADYLLLWWQMSQKDSCCKKILL